MMQRPMMQRLHLDGLADDVLMLIARNLARQVLSYPSALKSLAQTNRALSNIVADSWPVAAAALGINQAGPPQDMKQPVLAVCQADAVFSANALGPSRALLPNVRIAVGIAARKGGGWIGQLFDILSPHGLVVAELESSLQSAPFVVVPCDPAPERAQTRGDLESSCRSIITWPCAAPRCLDPATPGCKHCGKHGGRGAKRVVRQWIDQVSADPPESSRWILFAAQSEATAHAYRRAIAEASAAYSPRAVSDDAGSRKHAMRKRLAPGCD